MNKQSKMLTLETHKKKFVRNFKSMNGQSTNAVNQVPSLSNLPDDVNKTLRRNGINL